MAKVEDMVSTAGEHPFNFFMTMMKSDQFLMTIMISINFLMSMMTLTAGLEITARCDSMLEEEEPRIMLKVIPGH